MRFRDPRAVDERDPAAGTADEGPTSRVTPGPAAGGTDAAAALALSSDRVGEISRATREIVAALDHARRARARGSAAESGERLLAMLADRTRQLGSEADELAARIGAARRELGVREAARTPRPAPNPVVQASPGPPARAPAPPSEGVRMLIGQMNAAGSSPLEIEEQLRHELGIVDARALVEQVLGSEGAQSERG